MAPAVLVIEDDPRTVRLLELILGSQGYQMTIATSGDEGLTTLRSGRFDLILLDLMLPGVDGFEVLRQIRDDPAVADVPVVITSARARPVAKQEAADLGADAYITKPYRKAEVLGTIDSLVSNRV
ncbi:MAG: response regulator [Anaerolineae bacterium]|jgi:CheY-like chemotaxis protein